MKKLLFIAMIACVPLFLTGCAKDDQISQLQKQNQDLQAQLAKQQSNDFDLQSKCSQQAKVFLDYFEGGKSAENISYENHFNQKLNKCFVLISQFQNTAPNKIEFLFDAAEKKEYAESDSSGYCSLLIGGAKCNSEAEFNGFVSSYMSDSSTVPSVPDLF